MTEHTEDAITIDGVTHIYRSGGKTECLLPCKLDLYPDKPLSEITCPACLEALVAETRATHAWAFATVEQAERRARRLREEQQKAEWAAERKAKRSAIDAKRPKQTTAEIVAALQAAGIDGHWVDERKNEWWFNTGAPPGREYLLRWFKVARNRIRYKSDPIGSGETSWPDHDLFGEPYTVAYVIAERDRLAAKEGSA